MQQLEQKNRLPFIQRMEPNEMLEMSRLQSGSIHQPRNQLLNRSYEVLLHLTKSGKRLSAFISVPSTMSERKERIKGLRVQNSD